MVKLPTGQQLMYSWLGHSIERFPEGGLRKKTRLICEILNTCTAALFKGEGNAAIYRFDKYTQRSQGSENKRK